MSYEDRKASEIEKLEKECHELFDMAFTIDQCFLKKNEEYIKKIQQQTDEILKPIQILSDNLNGILRSAESQMNHLRNTDTQTRRDEITKPYYEKYHKLQKKIWALEKSLKKSRSES